MKTCSVAGCEKGFLARGLCGAHYWKWSRYGDPLGKAPRVPPEERFWAKVEKTDSCWLWTGSRTKTGDYGRGGYGQLHLGPRPVPSHRFAYELLVGPIPDGMLVCHTCDTPPCVNPAHLFLGTKKTNADDMVAKGRHRPARLTGDASPTRSTARRERRAEVLRLYATGLSQAEIARRTGMTASNVNHIIHGRSWR